MGFGLTLVQIEFSKWVIERGATGIHARIIVNYQITKLPNYQILSSPNDPLRPQEHLHVFRALGVAALPAILIAGLHKAAEERMRLQRFGLELGMELAAQEIRMIGNLHDLHVCTVRRGAGDAQPAAGEHRFILAVELIAMAMALANL